jgi:hypothetical protein
MALTAQWVARLAGEMPPGPQAWLATLDLAVQAGVENKPPGTQVF